MVMVNLNIRRPSSKPQQTTSWDPALIISQIVSLQAIHYLALSLLIPPLLSLLSNKKELEYEGGSSNVAMIMDWREVASRPALPSSYSSYEKLAQWVWSGGRKWTFSNSDGSVYADGVDQVRGWIIGLCWLCCMGVDTFAMYYIIRHPRLILDFTVTLHFIHTILTTYYSASFPTSLYYWFIMGIACVGTLVTAEWLCVKREMNVGLKVDPADGEEEIEMGSLLRQRDDAD